jgi:hypothetical protein
MARFVAVSDVPGMTEAQFREALGPVKKWRFGSRRRSWIIKAYCNLDQGKVVVECETPDRAEFEQWLEGTGWKTDDLYPVSFIHEAATIWPV